MAKATLVLFSKFLTKTDIETHLCISTSSLGQLPFEGRQTVNMHVHDEGGRKWLFPCSIKEDENMGRFLSVDWLEFARLKDVRVGDQFIIQEEIVNHQAAGTLIRIEVLRKIRLFGFDIWATV